jgi:hypothetical protein
MVVIPEHAKYQFHALKPTSIADSEVLVISKNEISPLLSF